MSGSVHWHSSSLVLESGADGLKYILRLPPELAQDRLHEGDHVVVHGVRSSPHSASNPGGFDSRVWMMRNGWTGYIEVRRVRVLHEHNPEALSDRGRAAQIHAWIQHRLEYLFPDPHVRAIMMAMISGDRSEVTDGITHAFRLAGLSHLLAISGLHFSIVLGVVWLVTGWFVSRFPVPTSKRRLVICMLVVCAAGFFATLVGWTASVTRSFLMVLVTILCLLSDRRGWLERSIILSALTITLWDAGQWRFMGMQLSFCAVSGIAISLRLHARFSGVSSVSSPVISAMIVSSGAFSGTAPVLLISMGWVPTIGLLVSPVAIVLTSMALSSTVIALILPLGDAPLAFIAYLAMKVVLNGACWIANTDLMMLRAANGQIGYTALFLICATLASTPLMRAYWRMILLLVATSMIIWSITPTIRLELTVLDVGQGDAMMVTYPQTSDLVVDTGAGSLAGRTIANALEQRGRFGANVLLTHGDRDHTGGLSSLAELIDVETVFSPWLPHQFEAGKRIKAGYRLEMPSSVRGYVLHPVEPGDTNADSVVLLMVFGTQGILLTGDIHAEEELIIIERYGSLLDALDDVVIKVPHHGSSTSSSEEILNRIKPSLAIVSAGASNRFDHPDADVLARYETLNIPVLNTASSGAIHLSISQDSYAVSVHKDGHWSVIALPH